MSHDWPGPEDVEAEAIASPWNDMIVLTDNSNRGVGIMLESVVQAQNETNRLLAIIANRLGEIHLELYRRDR